MEELGIYTSECALRRWKFISHNSVCEQQLNSPSHRQLSAHTEAHFTNHKHAPVTKLTQPTVHRDLQTQGCIMYVPLHLLPRKHSHTDAEPAARIKKNKKSSQIKFKVRCQKNLYTLVLKDSEKAEKLKQSLPPSTLKSSHALFHWD